MATNAYWQQIGDNMNGVNSGDDFGRSIGMNSEGTRMVIGSPNHNNNIGKVDIYDLVNDYWTNVGNEIVGIENGGNFGYSVTMSSNGNRIIVGAYGSNSTKGLVRMYELNDTEPVSWQQMGNDIDGVASDDKFGFSVDMNSLGNRVIIGSPDYDKSSTSQNNGMVAVYEWDNSNWIQIDENIIGKSKTDQFGYSVAMNNQDSRIAIGAPTYGTTNRGAVFLYYLNEQNVWEPVGGLSDIGPIPNEGFISGSIDHEWLGYSLDMSGDGNRIIVGIPLPSSSAGRARVYDFNTNTNQWEQMGNDNQLSGLEVGEKFGYSVSISDNGNRIAIGTPQHDRLPGDELGDWPDIGKASIYDWNSSSSQWEQVRSDIQGFEKNDESGTNVLLSDDGSVLAIGAIGGNGNGTVRVLEYKPYGSIVERFILNYIPAGKQDIFSRPTLEWSNVRKDVVKNSISKWNSIIVSLPGSDQERKFVLNLYNVVMSGDVLGTAGPMGLSNNFTNPYYIYYSTSGRVMMNNNIDVSTDDDKTYFQAVLEHEIGHVFGIGTFWFRNNVPNTGILKIAAGDAELAGNTTNLILQRQGDSDDNRPLYRTTYDDASFTLITNIYVFFQRDNNNIATGYWFGDIDGTNYYPRDSISFPRLDTNKTYTIIAGEDLSLGSFILENNSGVTITGNPLTTIGTLMTVVFNTPRIETNELFYSKTDGSWRGELSLDFKQSLYTGASALEVYKFYNAGGDTYKKNDTIETNYSNSTYSGMSNDNIKGIPIEDGNIFLNIGGHLDEGIDVEVVNNTTWCCLGGIVTKVQQRSDFYGNNTDTSEIVDYPPLRDELMTGLKSAPSGKKDPLSAITIGLMEDLGYGVDWSKAESYSLNMNLGGSSSTIQVTKGWNMIGISSTGQIVDNDNIIIPGTLYHFDGGSYNEAIHLNALEANKGYWIKCSGSGSITLQKDIIQPNQSSVDVIKGWNMIGVSENSGISDPNNLIIAGTLYHFDGSNYGTSLDISNIESNKGYWVKCNDVGSITINLAI